jgi:hypothetical protein
MDADVFITIAFCLYAFVFGLASGVFVFNQFQKTRLDVAAETGRGRGDSLAPTNQPAKVAAAQHESTAWRTNVGTRNHRPGSVASDRRVR